MEIIRDIEQGSDAWHQLRLGSVGGSSVNSVLAGGAGKMRKTLLYKMAGEILTNTPTNNFQSPHFDRGHEWEPVARKHYEDAMSLKTGEKVEVEEVAMIKGMLPRHHHSPDGIIDGVGGIEIKTREPHIYIDLIQTEKIPLADIRQCQNFLAITKWEWIDYVVYCVPEMEKRPAWIKRIYPDVDMIAEINEKVYAFNEDVDRLVEEIAG